MVQKLRSISYKIMCRIGLHNMTCLPTVACEPSWGFMQYEVCCVRCGKKSKDETAKILIKILNKLEDMDK